MRYSWRCRVMMRYDCTGRLVIDPPTWAERAWHATDELARQHRSQWPASSPISGSGKLTVNTTVSFNKREYEEEKGMYLYGVTVVGPGGAIVIDRKVVAGTEEEAKFKAGVYSLLESTKQAPGDLPVVVRALGRIEPGVKRS